MAIFQVIEQDGQKTLVEVPVGGNETWGKYIAGTVPADPSAIIADMPVGSYVTDDKPTAPKVAPAPYNTEVWITESGTWTAPVRGWFDVTAIAGGNGGMFTSGYVSSGNSGEVIRKLLHFEQGQKVPVTIGAGGLTTKTSNSDARAGGDTVFGNLTARAGKGFLGGTSVWYSRFDNNVGSAQLVGAGAGGGQNYMPPVSSVDADYHVSEADGTDYGAGGSASAQVAAGAVVQYVGLGKGAPGAVRLRYYDPNKKGNE
ncbi:MAG: hypothetical protein HDQ88_09020 [Clostridia bacterium]|nr:hypothetical protein [Clostridia bacterium]